MKIQTENKIAWENNNQEALDIKSNGNYFLFTVLHLFSMLIWIGYFVQIANISNIQFIKRFTNVCLMK